MSDVTNSHDQDAEPSDRYELSDLFADEAEDTQQVLKMFGVILLFVLLALALSIPFTYIMD